jgi:hypothetical protein
MYKQTNSLALSPQANYTDSAIATFRRNLVSTFVNRGVSRGHRGGSPTVVKLSFLDRSRYFFFQVALHLSSQGLSEPCSKPADTQENLVAPGIEPGTSFVGNLQLSGSVITSSWMLFERCHNTPFQNLRTHYVCTIATLELFERGIQFERGGDSVCLMDPYKSFGRAQYLSRTLLL